MTLANYWILPPILRNWVLKTHKNFIGKNTLRTISCARWIVSTMPHCALDSFARIFSASGKSWVYCFLYFLLFSFAAHSASKVRPTVILASLEGTAHTLTLDDEFKVSL